MRYNPFKHYDKHGTLKPPWGLYLCLAFLLRSYFIWIAALSFRQDTTRLLGFFYPNTESFLLALALAVPALGFAVILSCRRIGMPQWIERLWHGSTKLLIASVLLQISSLFWLMPAFHHLTPLSQIVLFVVEAIVLASICCYGLFNRHLQDACSEFPRE